MFNLCEQDRSTRQVEEFTNFWWKFKPRHRNARAYPPSDNNAAAR